MFEVKSRHIRIISSFYFLVDLSILNKVVMYRIDKMPLQT